MHRLPPSPQPPSPSEDTPGADRLLATMRNALHAMAQPLTLLQTRLYLALATGEDAPPDPHALSCAAADLDQLCLLFNLSQELLRLETSTPCLADLPLSRLLTTVVDDAEAVLAGTGVHLRLEHDIPPAADPDPPTPLTDLLVRVDAARFRHAVAHLLGIARELTLPNSPILCSLALDQVSVQMRIRVSVEAAHPGSLSEPAQLRLAVAAANLRNHLPQLTLCWEPTAMVATLAIPRCSR